MQISSDIRSLSITNLEKILLRENFEKYRATQIFDWLTKENIHSFEQMKNLPKELIHFLNSRFKINNVVIQLIKKSRDGTVKFLLSLTDNYVIEAVLIPTEKRITACVSSQVGCSLDCDFCATAKIKRMRNLDFYEIFDQLMILNFESLKLFGRSISNIVFRGSFYLTHACGTRWIDEGVKGSVISILTTWIWNGGPFTVPSAMSKAGVNIMTKSLAAEWGHYGIRLNAIAPGPFPTKGAWERLSPGQDTDSNENDAKIPMRRNGEMQELRNLATFLMADGCDYLTGQTIAIDGAGHLGSAGNFYQSLDKLTDEDWDGIRSMIKSSNDADKAKRSV